MGDMVGQSQHQIQKDILSSVFELIGISNVAEMDSFSSLDSSFSNSGIRGVSKMIKLWSKAVRMILADEDQTRSQVHMDFGFCRTMGNLWDRVSSRKLLSLSEFESAVAHQGTRPIPPFMMDKVLVRSLLPNPEFNILSRLVPLSNLGRTTSVPGKEDLLEALEVFCRNVESDHDFGFDFSASAGRLFRTLPGRFPKSASWSLTNHASLEYSRSAGGKTSEVIAKVIEDFQQSLVIELIPTRPVGCLYDILGNLVISPEIWDRFGTVGEGFYTELVHQPGNIADSRLGNFGLLWSIIEVLHNGAQGTCVFPGLSYGTFEIAIPDHVDFDCRISLLAEEGWKSRILTIADLSLAIVGQVFRSFVDPVMKSNRCLEIGLTDKVKLYSFMRHVTGSASAASDISVPSIIPGRCESVDLTTATDTSHRRVIKQFLEAFLGNCSPFLRFASNLATSRRRFSHSGDFVGEVLPQVHNSAIFMGEGASGTFLNAQSLWVRSIVHDFRVRFPGLDQGDLDNQHCTDFIIQNHRMIQEFLDSSRCSIHSLSTQSGDDVVMFTNFRLVNYFRILYLMVGMIPSSTTWYSSSQFGLFTEEVALRTTGSNGWKFVDSIKPRLLNCQMGVGLEEPILSHIRSIKSTCQYVNDPTIRLQIIGIADRIIDHIPRIKDSLSRGLISKAFPSSIGGIDHPVLYVMSKEDLSKDEVRILCGLSDIPYWQHIFREYLRDDDPTGLEAIFHDFIHDLSVRPISEFSDPDPQNLISVANIAVPVGITRFREVENYKKTRLREIGFQLLSDVLPVLAGRIKLTCQLRESVTDRIKSNPIKRLKRRFQNLCTEFSKIDPDNSDNIIRGWEFLRNFNYNIKSFTSGYAISDNLVESLCDGHNLVSLSVRCGNFLHDEPDRQIMVS